MIDIQKFKEQGYLIIPNCIPKDNIDMCKDICLSIKHLVVDNNLEGTKKSFGVEKYWKGINKPYKEKKKKVKNPKAVIFGGLNTNSM